MRGNNVMKGYLKNRRRPSRRSPAAGSTPAISAVMHPDGYIEIKDRSKDIIISGGENISTIEVEGVLTPPRRAGSRRGRPAGREMGRTPCAFVTLRTGAGQPPTRSSHLPRHSRPSKSQTDTVRRAAEDLDRQDPEIRPARYGQGPMSAR